MKDQWTFSGGMQQASVDIAQNGTQAGINKASRIFFVKTSEYTAHVRTALICADTETVKKCDVTK